MNVKYEFQEEDVRLIGTLIPRYSRFLPRPPRSKNQEYYFSYQCFRLVCERLFGRAACYSVYSTEIPAREYKDPHLELVVTKVNNNNLYMYLQTGVRYSSFFNRGSLIGGGRQFYVKSTVSRIHKLMKNGFPSTILDMFLLQLAFEYDD